MQKVDDPFGGLTLAVVFARGAADAQGLLDPAAASLEGAPGKHVVEHTHAFEQGDVLKGAGNAAHRHLLRAHAPVLLPGKADAPLLGLVHAVDHIQQ
ncbi:hypothetical protein PS685_05348 [Pseudomonas fluorescens]|uniref:Uncharacterized protein n=1 Tax=Pseudomonas fluorescens TaxID=294 RepID=A0A5E7AKD7_PSEFL|nr:hypothetical protein PS685_05348 [Pseudomonas fluorescens]